MSFVHRMMSTGFNTLVDIKNAYYNDGEIKVPTDEELKVIEKDTSSMRLAGKGLIGGGVLGTAVSYVLWSMPYVGPICAVVTGIVSLASGVIGYDVTKIADNLNEFSQKRVSNVGQNVLNILRGKKHSEKEFKEQLLKTAVKGTILSSSLFDIANRKCD